ncbi:heavy metal transport/detoxification protein [Acrocarpospora pleiomorpha]|uniref:Heavy metal transport/detoxification protein n=1 Tax=Acrocarpospora pleiomorpha TaxID=90975 RepID=A0A5M3XRP8_9ACTN|nr:heavy metal-associated domain-containing protein [Acrocarpospora pleiomorpha]GES23722.1 heavy metal transport/detoxification protein [Acrocarpospora pleiomorpha]
MTTHAYVVQGMHCQNCVATLTGKVSQVPGVSGVDIDLPTGRMEITGADPVVDAAIRQIIEESGYTLT